MEVLNKKRRLDDMMEYEPSKKPRPNDFYYSQQSNQETYVVISEMQLTSKLERLERIIGEMSSNLYNLNQTISSMDNKINDLNSRLDNIENKIEGKKEVDNRYFYSYIS